MKYYRVKQDNFLWQKDAILTNEKDINGYMAIEDIWDTTEFTKTDYVSTKIVENNPKYFERVYNNNLEKHIFVTSNELKKIFNKMVA